MDRRKISIEVSDELRQAWPGFQGAAVFANVKNSDYSEELWKRIGEFTELYRSKYTTDSIKDMPSKSKPVGAAEKELLFTLNNTIKRVTEDMETFSFNTAIARIMELVNALAKYDALEKRNVATEKAAARDLVLLLAPFAPHFCEELWEECGGRDFVFEERYPVADEKALALDEKEYAVQVNSKMACRAMISTSATEDEIKALVLALPEVQEKTAGKSVKKCIVVPGRLVNLIVG